ncbi:MAG: DUF4012 domain-containing protein [Chloroflexota bacterium]|nr:DUF4012 domain-containing protein [Chloroflexota bacterium]
MLFLLGLAGGMAIFRYLPAIDDARMLRGEVESIGSRVQQAGIGINRPQLDSIQQDVVVARERLDRLAGLLAHDPLVGLGRMAPPTSADVRGADAIVSAADDIFDAAEAGLTVAGRYVDIKASQAADPENASALALVVEMMATTQQPVATASASLKRAESTLGAVPGGLADPIESAREAMAARIASYGPALDAYVEVAADLSGILGWEEPRRYLVLTQNPAELRPTGGFIGSYGLVSFDKGRITERTFQDVYLLDNPVDYPYVEPPPALVQHVLRPGLPWPLRDANWSPDFPTSARDALRLYVNESGDTTVDGVVAVTTNTIDELLRITGPITVPDYDVTLAAGETTLKVLELTRASDDPDENRKAFLSSLADELIAELLALPPERWSELLGAKATFENERLVLAWFSDPAHQQLAVDNGFDGAVRSDAGDYLYPVDSNVRPFSKLSAITTRALDLDVVLDTEGNARNTLDVTWNNRILTPGGAPHRAVPEVGQLRSLGMYFRLLVPERSELEPVSGGNLDVEAGRAVISDYLEVPPGSTTLRNSWVSPEAAATDEAGGLYRLTIQKQPGLLPGPITVAIHVPDGFRITNASEGLTVSGGTATLETTFDQDISIALRYGP